MIDTLSAWWRARTAREQRLVQAAAVLLFVLALPLTAIQQAADFRRTAEGDLAAALELEAAVARLAAQDESSLPPIVSDGTIQSAAVIAAQEQGLTVARTMPSGPDRVLLTFEASDSRGLMRWLDRMVRSGFDVSGVRMARVGEGDLVTAEFDVGSGG